MPCALVFCIEYCAWLKTLLAHQGAQWVVCNAVEFSQVNPLNQNRGGYITSSLRKPSPLPTTWRSCDVLPEACRSVGAFAAVLRADTPRAELATLRASTPIFKHYRATAAEAAHPPIRTLQYYRSSPDRGQLPCSLQGIPVSRTRRPAR